MKKQVKEGMFWGAVTGAVCGIINIPKAMIGDLAGPVKFFVRPILNPIEGAIMGAIFGGMASEIEQLKKGDKRCSKKE